MSGFSFFTNYAFIWEQILNISILLLIVYAITNIVSIDFKNKHLSLSISIEVILSIVSIILINMYSNIYLALYPIIIGAYVLLISISRFVRAYIYFQDQLKWKITMLFDAFISLFFAIALMIHPSRNFNVLSYWLGSYFIIYGLSFIIQGFSKMFLSSDALFTMPVPVFIGALLTGNTLDHIDELKNTEADIKTDLEVFIYLREGFFGRFGHMDFSYKGLTYSYGGFDPHTQKLGGSYGDGVLIVADRDPFLKHGNLFKKATIVKYGLNLNETQHCLIQQNIDDLLNSAYPYPSDAENDFNEGRLKDNYDTYLNNVYLKTKAKTYTFKQGAFKTYFVLSTNCVKVVSHILRMKDLKLIDLKGVVTSGTYLNYFNNEYLNKSNIVVSRYVYRLENGETIEEDKQ